MKIKNIVVIGMLLGVLSGVTISQAEVDIRVIANFSELNEYGEWVMVPGYGTVWRPDASPDWRPFTYGHWVYSDDGWVWDSDEPFGWIVSHYGNWFFDDDQGWVWLPGNTWSPARVRWYVTDNEIGWAPLFPNPVRGYSHHATHLQWHVAPVLFFTSVEVRNHMVIRREPAPGTVRVNVFAGPPGRAFVQRHNRAPIVSIVLNKTRVTTNNRSLVRVEVENRSHSNVEVPVGAKYKRVTVRSQGEAIPVPRRKIGVTDDRDVRAESRQTPQQESKVKVNVRSTRNNKERKEDEDEKNKKDKVEVRIR